MIAAPTPYELESKKQACEASISREGLIAFYLNISNAVVCLKYVHLSHISMCGLLNADLVHLCEIFNGAEKSPAKINSY
jgi:hypothetical protein